MNSSPLNFTRSGHRKDVVVFSQVYQDHRFATQYRNMTSSRLPPITAVPNLPSQELIAILDHLFEPCVPLHTLSIDLLRTQQFSSYDDCIANIGAQLTTLANSASSSDTEWLESILTAHPRLGEKKIDSKQSLLEQAQLASSGDPNDDLLVKMNAMYETTFPGLRYV